MEPVIRLRSVSKIYKGADNAAVDGIDLSVRSGEIVALLGPNGAGKSTTLDMVLGFIAPSEGSVEVFGTSPAEAVDQGRLSAVLQSGGLLRDLRVRETVELVASTYPNPAPIDEVLERAGLGAIGDRKVQVCSGGEQQRLRFALALLADPDLMILDEPTAGMDVEARQQFWATMRAEAQKGRTIVFATHYLQEAEDFAERTVLMAEGRIVADGPTEEVRRRGSGRRLRVRIPPDRLDATKQALGARSDVLNVATSSEQLLIDSSDSDTVARLLLTDFDGHDLEIESASLETAFVALIQPTPEPTLMAAGKRSAS